MCGLWRPRTGSSRTPAGSGGARSPATLPTALCPRRVPGCPRSPALPPEVLSRSTCCSQRSGWTPRAGGFLSQLFFSFTRLEKSSHPFQRLDLPQRWTSRHPQAGRRRAGGLGRYLARIAVAQVQGSHEVGVVLLDTGWPFCELCRLQTHLSGRAVQHDPIYCVDRIPQRTGRHSPSEAQAVAPEPGVCCELPRRGPAPNTRTRTPRLVLCLL